MPLNLPTHAKLMGPVVRPKTGQLFFWVQHYFAGGEPAIEKIASEIRITLQKTDP